MSVPGASRMTSGDPSGSEPRSSPHRGRIMASLLRVFVFVALAPLATGVWRVIDLNREALATGVLSRRKQAFSRRSIGLPPVSTKLFCADIARLSSTQRSVRMARESPLQTKRNRAVSAQGTGSRRVSTISPRLGRTGATPVDSGGLLWPGQLVAVFGVSCESPTPSAS